MTQNLSKLLHNMILCNSVLDMNILNLHNLSVNFFLENPPDSILRYFWSCWSRGEGMHSLSALVNIDIKVYTSNLNFKNFVSENEKKSGWTQ